MYPGLRLLTRFSTPSRRSLLALGHWWRRRCRRLTPGMYRRMSSDFIQFASGPRPNGSDGQTLRREAKVRTASLANGARAPTQWNRLQRHDRRVTAREPTRGSKNQQAKVRRFKIQPWFSPNRWRQYSQVDYFRPGDKFARMVLPFLNVVLVTGRDAASRCRAAVPAGCGTLAP